MFMVKCKYFADANITKYFKHTQVFCDFFPKKIHHLPLIH